MKKLSVLMYCFRIQARDRKLPERIALRHCQGLACLIFQRLARVQALAIYLSWPVLRWHLQVLQRSSAIHDEAEHKYTIPKETICTYFTCRALLPEDQARLVLVVVG